MILKILIFSLLLKECWRVFPREWLTSIPLVWPYCIPVLLLPLERDSELLRERESVLRLRERRWLDGASFDTERGSTSREGEANLDKKSIPVQSPVSLGEELQWWPDKVSGAKGLQVQFFLLRVFLIWFLVKGLYRWSTFTPHNIYWTLLFLFQDGVKFVSIGAMFSELVAVSSKGELYQWKWSEPEPFRNAQVWPKHILNLTYIHDSFVLMCKCLLFFNVFHQNPSIHHPRVSFLGLANEKITLLSANSIRATVATETNKVNHHRCSLIFELSRFNVTCIYWMNFLFTCVCSGGNVGGWNTEFNGLQVGTQCSGFPWATRGTYGIPALLCTLHMCTAGEWPLLVVGWRDVF